MKMLDFEEGVTFWQMEFADDGKDRDMKVGEHKMFWKMLDSSRVFAGKGLGDSSWYLKTLEDQLQHVPFQLWAAGARFISGVLYSWF